MIRAALADKFRASDALGLAADALEAIVVCACIGAIIGVALGCAAIAAPTRWAVRVMDDAFTGNDAEGVSS